ncbi:MAG: hypothetical protein GXP27_03505 [Planctomycetes bacterium]|nr:hypothetical protein [Planctomycetota bacterium]
MNHGTQHAIAAFVFLTAICFAAPGCQKDVTPPTITVKPAAQSQQAAATSQAGQNVDSYAEPPAAAKPADSGRLTNDASTP